MTPSTIAPHAREAQDHRNDGDRHQELERRVLRFTYHLVEFWPEVGGQQARSLVAEHEGLNEDGKPAHSDQEGKA